MARRIRYNRASIEDTILAALAIVTDHPLYVFAVYGGYTIDKNPPAFQTYYRIIPDWVTLYEYQGWEQGYYTERELGKPK